MGLTNTQTVGPVIPERATEFAAASQSVIESGFADEDRMNRPAPAKNARPDVESRFMDPLPHLLRQKEVGHSSENTPSQTRRTADMAQGVKVIEPQMEKMNGHLSALSPKGATPAVGHNTGSVAYSQPDPASRPAPPETVATTAGMPDRAAVMTHGEANASGRDAQRDKNTPLMTARAANPGDREAFTFRLESVNTASLPDVKGLPSESPAASRTQAVINQIIDARQSMNGDFGRIRIVLSPPNLGTVDLEIVVRNERVEVLMKADNGGVQQALQSRSDDIRNALQRHDLKIESFQVLLQDQDANRQQSHGGALFEQRRNNQAPHDFKGTDTLPSSSPAASVIQGWRPEKGRVSIFV